jgi:hypothetical protein
MATAAATARVCAASVIVRAVKGAALTDYDVLTFLKHGQKAPRVCEQAYSYPAIIVGRPSRARQCKSQAGMRRHMLSSLNAYGGLSATQLLTLIGANSSSSSDSSNSQQTSRAELNQASSAGKPDPASAIKSILAQSQINQSPTFVLGGLTTANTDDVTQSLEYLNVTRAPIGPFIAQAGYATMTSSDSITAMTYSDALGVENTTIVNAGVVSSDTANVPTQTNSSTTIQFGRSIANSSVSVGFSVDNLGPMVDNDGTYSPVNPQGTFQVELQLDFDAAQGTANDGESMTAGGQAINVNGLTESQAQDLLNAYEKATDSAQSINTAAPSFVNTENLVGMDVVFSGLINGGTPA